MITAFASLYNKFLYCGKSWHNFFLSPYSMLLIDDILIDQDVVTSSFSCDLEKCKGACCTFPGDSGAPLLEHEIDQIKKAAPFAKEYLSKRSLEILDKNGFHEIVDDELATVCIDKKDCVFVFYEGDVAKCALEKAYFDGKTDFRKPISCHLFPIRVGKFGGDKLYYEKFDECKPGRKKGKSEKVKLLDSVKDALIRAYGEDWFLKLKKEVEKNYE